MATAVADAVAGEAGSGPADQDTAATSDWASVYTSDTADYRDPVIAETLYPQVKYILFFNNQ